MSGWSSDYSKYPRLFNGKCDTPKPLCKVSIERQRSKSGQSMIINTRHKKPEIPVPAVIPPWPATTPSRPPGKVCYCVERSAEQHFFLVLLHPWLITQNFQDKTEDGWYGRPAVSPVGTTLLSVAISSRGASPTVIPSPTEEETQLKVSSKMGHHFVPPTHPHNTLVNSSIKERKANYLISAYPRILSVSSLPLYDQKFISHSSEFLSEALEKYSWLCLRNIQTEDKWLNFCDRVQCSRWWIAHSENLVSLGI